MVNCDSLIEINNNIEKISSSVQKGIRDNRVIAPTLLSSLRKYKESDSYAYLYLHSAVLSVLKE